MRELDFDVSKDGLRLRARYDKERAVDLGDVVGKVGGRVVGFRFETSQD